MEPPLETFPPTAEELRAASRQGTGIGCALAGAVFWGPAALGIAVEGLTWTTEDLLALGFVALMTILLPAGVRRLMVRDLQQAPAQALAAAHEVPLEPGERLEAACSAVLLAEGGPFQGFLAVTSRRLRYLERDGSRRRVTTLAARPLPTRRAEGHEEEAIGPSIAVGPGRTLVLPDERHVAWLAARDGQGTPALAEAEAEDEDEDEDEDELAWETLGARGEPSSRLRASPGWLRWATLRAAVAGALGLVVGSGLRVSLGFALIVAAQASLEELLRPRPRATRALGFLLAIVPLVGCGLPSLAAQTAYLAARAQGADLAAATGAGLDDLLETLAEGIWALPLLSLALCLIWSSALRLGLWRLGLGGVLLVCAGAWCAPLPQQLGQAGVPALLVIGLVFGAQLALVGDAPEVLDRWVLARREGATSRPGLLELWRDVLREREEEAQREAREEETQREAARDA
ncbi:MAG: hypothetical protein AB7N76_23595 [Planctomycetota bacterium]